MKLIIYFFALMAAVSGGSSPAKIVGGRPIKITDAPYQVGVCYFEMQMCGGTLVTYNLVLSAAHCVNNKIWDYLSVFAGTEKRFYGGIHTRVKSVHVHPLYNPSTNDYDAVGLKLSNPMPERPSIKTIAVSTHTPIPNQLIFITGWGATAEKGNSSSVLLGAYITVVDRWYCRSIYGPSLTDSMFCAGYLPGGIDTCQGDSGGPAVIVERNVSYLGGIVSWGAGCARKFVPGIYVDASKLLDWIKTLL